MSEGALLVKALLRPTFRNRWYRTPSFVAGASIVGILALVALAAPLVAPYDPVKQDLLAALQGPSSQHWLGTDQLGRDVFSRLVYAARIDLRIAVISVVLSMLLGGLLGCLAGYLGGAVETVIMRLADVLSATPIIVVVMALVFVLGQGEGSIYMAVTLVAWVAYARIMRADVFIAKRREYVLAARAGGLPTWRILTRHILPNTATQAITFGMVDIVNIIMVIVFLGYLGLGIRPPTPEWGVMIADGQALLQTKWYLTTVPGIAVVVTGLGFSLFGDGLADLLRPE